MSDSEIVDVAPVDSAPVADLAPSSSRVDGADDGDGMDVAGDFRPIQTQEALDKVIQSRLERAQRAADRKYSKQLEELSSKIKTYEDEKLTADERKEKRLAELEATLAEAQDRYTKLERTRLVETLAREMGLPEKFWSRVQGSTDDEIISDIHDMLEGLPQVESKNGFVPSQAPKVTSVQSTGTDPEVEENAKGIVDKLDSMFSF